MFFNTMIARSGAASQQIRWAGFADEISCRPGHPVGCCSRATAARIRRWGARHRRTGGVAMWRLILRAAILVSLIGVGTAHADDPQLQIDRARLVVDEMRHDTGF